MGPPVEVWCWATHLIRHHPVELFTNNILYIMILKAILKFVTITPWNYILLPHQGPLQQVLVDHCMLKETLVHHNVRATSRRRLMS